MFVSSSSGRFFFIGLLLAAVSFVWLPAARCADQRASVPQPSAARTFADHLAEPRGLLIAPDGAMFVAEQRSGTVARIDRDGKVVRIARGLKSPHDLALDAAGNIYVAETGAGRVAKIAPSGEITTFLPDLESPVDLAFGPDGALWVCELTGKVRAVSSEGGSRVVAEAKGPHGLAFSRDGATYINDWRGDRVLKLEGGLVRSFAEIAGPVGIAIGPSGDLYVAQPQARRVSRIKPDGTRSILATDLDEPRDPAFDRKGNLYIAETLAGRIIVFAGNF
jgi:DNA-binding beta-propeller fold protein YncE